MAEAETKKEAIELKDGQEVIIDGQRFIMDGARLRLVEPENMDDEKHCWLVFKHLPVADDIKEVNGCSVVYEDHVARIDIYPLLEKAFGRYADCAHKNLSHISFFKRVDREANGESILVLQDRAKSDVIDDLNRMLDMSIVNQNQLKGFKDYINRTFTDLYHSIWEL